MSHLPGNKVYVVVPAYNEHFTISSVCEDLLQKGYSIIVVDDGSKPPLLECLPLGVIYLQHELNLGQGAALQTGFEYALEQGAEMLASFDADGQHLTSDLDNMVLEFEKNEYDILLGSRFLSHENHMSIGRKWLLHSARFVNFLFTGLLLTDAHNGLRLMNRKAAGKMKFENGMLHATEILYIIKKEKLRFREIPVTIHYTAYSRKKGQKAMAGFRILIDLILNKVFK